MTQDTSYLVDGGYRNDETRHTMEHLLTHAFQAIDFYQIIKFNESASV
jgi:hypothetical protein